MSFEEANYPGELPVPARSSPFPRFHEMVQLSLLPAHRPASLGRRTQAARQLPKKAGSYLFFSFPLPQSLPLFNFSSSRPREGRDEILSPRVVLLVESVLSSSSTSTVKSMPGVSSPASTVTGTG